MTDTLQDLPKLIAARDEALMLWRSVKRLEGPCLQLQMRPAGTASARYIGLVRFTREQRAMSHCTILDRPSNWCEPCRAAYKYWRRYYVLAHRVHRLTSDL